MFCYASSAVNGGAKAGITTCSLSTDFIISVPDGADNEWKVSMYPTLKTYFLVTFLDSMINMKRYLMMRQKAGLASKKFLTCRLSI